MRDTSVDRVDARFQRFYEEQFPYAARLARMLTGDPSAADDLAQDAFVHVYRYALTSPRPIDNPQAFLRTTIVNLCRSWYASQRRRQVRMARHGAADDVQLPDWERQLDDSLRRLPYDQRAVVVMRYWLGLSEAEIAWSLGCRAGTVKSRHARALRALRKELS